MSIFAWFDGADAKAYGQLIAAEILTGLNTGQQPRKPKSGKNREAAAEKWINTILTKVDAFRLQKRPNLYQKAKFLNALKWNLREAGVDEERVSQFVSLIAVRL